MKRVCLLLWLCLFGLNLSGQKIKVDTIIDKMYTVPYYEVKMVSKPVKGVPIKAKIVTTIFPNMDVGIALYIDNYILVDDKIMIKFDEYDPVEYEVYQSDNRTHYLLDDKYTFLQSLTFYGKSKMIIRANIMKVGFVDFEYNTLGAGEIINKNIIGNKQSTR